jgi:hypothetical protein
MMRMIGAARDERAAPLFVYIIEHTEFRGSLESIYMFAIDALGKTAGEAESVAALRKVLYRDEWWRPFRTARMREAAARALRMMVSDVAKQVLDEAASSGSRAVRRVARAALAAPGPSVPAAKDKGPGPGAPVSKDPAPGASATAAEAPAPGASAPASATPALCASVTAAEAPAPGASAPASTNPAPAASATAAEAPAPGASLVASEDIAPGPSAPVSKDS